MSWWQIVWENCYLYFPCWQFGWLGYCVHLKTGGWKSIKLIWRVFHYIEVNRMIPLCWDYLLCIYFSGFDSNDEAQNVWCVRLYAYLARRCFPWRTVSIWIIPSFFLGFIVSFKGKWLFFISSNLASFSTDSLFSFHMLLMRCFVADQEKYWTSPLLLFCGFVTFVMLVLIFVLFCFSPHG